MEKNNNFRSQIVCISSTEHLGIYKSFYEMWGFFWCASSTMVELSLTLYRSLICVTIVEVVSVLGLITSHTWNGIYNLTVLIYSQIICTTGHLHCDDRLSNAAGLPVYWLSEHCRTEKHRYLKLILCLILLKNSKLYRGGGGREML